jgi:hypothetical protein
MEIKNLDYHEDRWPDGNLTKEELIGFEEKSFNIGKMEIFTAQYTYQMEMRMS